MLLLNLFDARLWQDLTAMDMPWEAKILRPVLVYIFLIAALRVFGKRELAQLNPFDLVVLLTLSNTVQNAIIGADNSLIGGLVGALALLSINYVAVRLLVRHRWIGHLFAGQPVVLVHRGRVNRKALDGESMTEADLQLAARRQGFESLADVDECILEPGGVFYFHRRAAAAEAQQQVLNALAKIEMRLEHLGDR